MILVLTDTDRQEEGSFLPHATMLPLCLGGPKNSQVALSHPVVTLPSRQSIYIPPRGLKGLGKKGLLTLSTLWHDGYGDMIGQENIVQTMAGMTTCDNWQIYDFV